MVLRSFLYPRCVHFRFLVNCRRFPNPRNCSRLSKRANFLSNNCRLAVLFYKHFSNRKVKFVAMTDCSILDLCDFSMPPEKLSLKATELISECRKRYDTVAAVAEKDVNFDTVLKVLNDIECVLRNGFVYIKFFRFVSTDAALREASGKAEKEIADFIIETSFRSDLFSKIQILYNKKPNLPPEAQRYLKKLVEDGKRNGLHLPENLQKEVAALKKNINELGIQFCRNRTDANTIVEFADEELDGVNQDFINSLSTSVDTRKRKVTLKYPHVFPIMQKCKNPETRKTLSIACNSENITNNVAILEEQIKLRHKHATLLGYPNHVSYRVEILHAKSKDAIEKFLLDLYEKLQPLWKTEKAYLLELKEKECRELNLPYDGKLHNWDMSYYANKAKELKYNVDQEKYKEYFPLLTVQKGILDIYQDLLGLKFEEVENAKVWFPGVELYSVKDASSSKLLGYFFLDLYPREGKYTHFCVKDIQDSCTRADGTNMLSVVGMLCNFSPPQAGKPSLLQQHEVKTFFHEFGHVMHEICINREYAYFHQMRIERDFLEAPSQMLENWCWDAVPLKKMSSHYINQETLPDNMIETLIKSRLALVGYTSIRQIVLSLYDQQLHSQEKADTKSLYHDLCVRMLGIEPAEGTNFAAQFEHLALEYDAQYYSYLWSEVFSMDMFYTRFKDGNIMNPVVGKDYREKVLAPVKPAADLVRDFLGRDPTQDAFLESKGLKV